MQEIVFISNLKGHPLVLESCFIFWGCQKIKAAPICNRHIKSSYEWIFCKTLNSYFTVFNEMGICYVIPGKMLRYYYVIVEYF